MQKAKENPVYVFFTDTYTDVKEFTIDFFKSMYEMKAKSIWSISIFVGISILSLVGYFWFLNSTYFSVFESWTKTNFIVYASALIIIKIIGVLWPPLMGSAFTYGSIPVLGWETSYAIDFIGSMLGALCAYLLGKKYGKLVLNKIVDQDLYEKVSKLNFNKEHEIESIALLKLIGGGALVDFISYFAGLWNVSLKNFLIASIVSNLILTLPAFYFAHNVLSGKNLVVTFLLSVVIVITIIRLKKRYFKEL